MLPTLKNVFSYWPTMAAKISPLDLNFGLRSINTLKSIGELKTIKQQKNNQPNKTMPGSVSSQNNICRISGSRVQGTVILKTSLQDSNHSQHGEPVGQDYSLAKGSQFIHVIMGTGQV